MTTQRRKRSPIWFINKSELEAIVKASTSISEILAHFDLSNKGGNYKTLQRRLKADEIDYGHIALGIGSNKGRQFLNAPKKPIEEFLVAGIECNTGHLKQRLLQEGILREECYICGQLPEWNGKPLVLQLDHINGDRKDNRIDNLRILCPHCHTQTETFAGRCLRKLPAKKIAFPILPPHYREADAETRSARAPAIELVDEESGQTQTDQKHPLDREGVDLESLVVSPSPEVLDGQSQSGSGNQCDEGPHCDVSFSRCVESFGLGKPNYISSAGVATSGRW